jgi:hypothetical protein
MDEELPTTEVADPTRPLAPAGEVAARSQCVAMSAFDAALSRRAPFRLDEAVRAEVNAEASTVLHAFETARDDVGIRESLALAALLARRAAELGLTGLELGAVTEALLEAMDAGREPLEEPHRTALRGMMIEGFGRALEERARERELGSRIACTRPIALARRCLALVLQGHPAAEWIAAAVESLGPALLAHDAAAVVVVGRFDDDLSSGAVAELAACVDTAGVVGARVFYSLPERAARALRARVGERAVVLEDDAATAVERALVAGEQSPVRARVAGLLRRLGV